MTMRLAGRANWWAPCPPRRPRQRFGIAEEAARAHGEGVLRGEYV
ncbi:hypothetical protein STRIP9103_00657 [Streptomyces ipomoeae 91-03]|uniref:Uncharacterized protein n=1 Tax=Streptomyces ipomoeae 91-03 TaxID=698759 RepID=L1L0F5_9ACTN|nr:hypothetical protein STRIP9103_00657 [Streptomyces ipomoeae 91-03]